MFVGYSRINPITTAGRLFAVFYGIIGIPVAVIVIAVSGRHLNTLATHWKKKVTFYPITNYYF